MRLSKLWALALIALTAGQSWGEQGNSLQFNPESNFVVKRIKVGEQIMNVRAYEGVSYVANPVSATYQTLNIYIPQAYIEAKELNEYTRLTAPILVISAIDNFKAVFPEKLMAQIVGQSPSPQTKTNQAQTPESNNSSTDEQTSQTAQAQAEQKEAKQQAEPAQQEREANASTVAEASTAEEASAMQSNEEQQVFLSEEALKQRLANPQNTEEPLVVKLDGKGYIVFGTSHNLTLPELNLSTSKEVVNQIGNLVQVARDGFTSLGEKVSSGIRNVQRTLEGTPKTDAPVAQAEKVEQEVAQLDQEDLTETKEFIAQALAHGYVVVTVGSRGFELENEQKEFVGKTPASLVDLKAAIKYIKANGNVIQGNPERIVVLANHGGANVGALVGLNQDDSLYQEDFANLGVAQANSQVHAVAMYSPHLNLSSADMAYEWGYSNVQEVQARPIPGMLGLSRAIDLTAEQLEQSQVLQREFVTYVNSLNLGGSKTPYTLNEDGTGSFRELVEQLLLLEAKDTLVNNPQLDLTDYPWLTVENGKVVKVDSYLYQAEVGRTKFPWSFDKLDLDSPYNRLFGDQKVAARHFAWSYLRDEYFAQQQEQERQVEQEAQDVAKASEQTSAPEIAQQNNEQDNSKQEVKEEKVKEQNFVAPLALVNNFNPSYHLANLDKATAANLTKYWWIRQGTFDSSYPIALPVIFAQQLTDAGLVVDFQFAWNQASNINYATAELFAWIDSISQASALQRTGVAILDSFQRLTDAFKGSKETSQNQENLQDPEVDKKADPEKSPAKAP
ncbi:hypothetical protein CKF54_02055 [Psittacicella hinzii]|uniref:BD-FAE-like domain-containing protein n=1 Tax=Psittacicella hinzii TaxID=2028575 RepID=A0A3A1Y6F1_9GAMM|nr:hypothetical protein [Psittacicella hinzii]RIY33842.1 hypothetical protein CKF54_02055 [Psittacicella hinzii]